MSKRIIVVALVVLALGASFGVATADVLPVTASWTNFYWSGSAPVYATPSFTVTWGGTFRLWVTDGFITGDQFEVYVDNVLAFTTNSVTKDIDTFATNGDSAWGDYRLSKGSILLGPGSYVVDIKVIDQTTLVAGGGAFIRATCETVVPEPSSVLALVSGLGGVLGLAWRRRK